MNEESLTQTILKITQSKLAITFVDKNSKRHLQ
jgi:hypothetical protein